MLTAWLLGAEMPATIFAILLVALVIDAAFGDPPWLYGTLPHPVVMIGRLVGLGEHRLNDGVRHGAVEPGRVAEGGVDHQRDEQDREDGGRRLGAQEPGGQHGRSMGAPAAPVNGRTRSLVAATGRSR